MLLRVICMVGSLSVGQVVAGCSAGAVDRGSGDAATTTLAPSRPNAGAVARPMPVLAPVTNATFPSKRPVTG
jgi:hypothetical protein